jgi:hypothetical protein
MSDILQLRKVIRSFTVFLREINVVLLIKTDVSFR